MTNERFDALFGGPPRDPETWLEQKHMDIAASIQAVLEDAVLRLTRSLAAETGMENLCLAGGMALVEAGLGDARPQIVGHHHRRNPTDERKGARVRADPVGQTLRPGGLGVGVVRRAEHGDEQLRRHRLAGRCVDHRERRAGVIDEQNWTSGSIRRPRTAARDCIWRARHAGLAPVNVEAYGLSEVVHIIEGFTTDAAVDAAVNRILDGRTIGLLFLDADGNVERDFEFYRGRLSRGSILVTEQAPEKQTTIKAWVDQAVASGFVENLGLYRWGTWVGRYWG